MIVIFLILFVELKTFPLFIQSRALTFRGSSFRIIKFKTIKDDFKSSRTISDENSVFLKPEFEKFIPPFSKVMRLTGMDELPQLLNVIAGKMSLIGPRPLMIADLELLQKDEPELLARRNELDCLPGITGLWQTLGNRQLGLQNLIELDLLYNKGISFSLDLIIFFITIPFILLGLSSDAILVKRAKDKIKISDWLILIKEQLLLKIKDSFSTGHF